MREPMPDGDLSKGTFHGGSTVVRGWRILDASSGYIIAEEFEMSDGRRVRIDFDDDDGEV